MHTIHDVNGHPRAHLTTADHTMAPTTRSRARQPTATRRATTTDKSASKNPPTRQTRTPKPPKKQSSAPRKTTSRSKSNAESPVSPEPKRSFQKLTGFSPTVEGNAIYDQDGTYIGRFSSRSPAKTVFRPGVHQQAPTTPSGTPLKTTYVLVPQYRTGTGNATPLTSIFAPITGSSRGAGMPSAGRTTPVSFGWRPETPQSKPAASSTPAKAAATRRQSTHQGNPAIDTNSHLSGILYAVYREIHDVRSFLDSEAYHPAFDPIIEALGPALEAIFDADQEVISGALGRQ
ncbi:hypothetical protein EJ03DRAFT_370665 [Teratosphaeria nubilosa]|uniref:Uncharacterized protein n=1 Tax=Teratosphaeria nubilosa TaxID=161662 RepID=A0A6G1LMZ3_9PEZI|nr:hypothetical protein EJ03DRAFT_370665 [Teratosphaeria nubilosa]